MSVPMVFVIGSPRSGTTMLERILASHSMILGGPEPHLLTPLAHLGVWANVDKAPYDHILAAQAQRLFVEALPNKDRDYWEACRAYCEVLYGRYLAASGKRFCLDKTPAYALILPFLMKVFPDAKYVVLIRHPIATSVSYANSFFDGNFELAHQYNPILARYVPAIASFLRQKEVPFIHVRYEDLVREPEKWVREICSYLGIPYESEMINYGKITPANRKRRGLGDPIAVEAHLRPTAASLTKWAEELAADPAKLDFMRQMINQLDPEDLRTLGYPLEELWCPFEELKGQPFRPQKLPLTAYRVQRKLIISLRQIAQKKRLFYRALKRLQLTCEVLLRE